MNENELMHYGVLGMKWGVRKDPSKTYAKVARKLNKLHDEYTYGNAFQRRKASRKSEKLRGAMYTAFAKIKSSDIDDESIRIGKNMWIIYLDWMKTHDLVMILNGVSLSILHRI